MSYLSFLSTKAASDARSKHTEDAPGIPSRETIQAIPEITKPKTWELGVHEHDAKKRGLHLDLRLGDPDTGHAHSWALTSTWPDPGKSVWAIQQPTHTVKYMDFKGTIPFGYGAGEVKLKDRGKTEIVKATDDHVSFNVYRGKGPEEYTLHRMKDKTWKLFNRTLTKEKLPEFPDRPDYKAVDAEHAHVMNPNYVMSAKLDDAHNLFVFPKDKPIRVVSYRATDRPVGVIEHTHKVDGVFNTLTPKELAGTVLRGGLLTTNPDTGRPIQVTRLSGLLNSNVWKSRADQEEHGKLRPVIYDVVEHAGKSMSDAPYKEKLEVLEKVHKALPQFELPPMAYTKGEKTKLLNEIQKGEHTATEEGVVLWNLNKSAPPLKVKFFPDYDVHLRGTFSGGGKYTDKGSGGFTYSHTPEGPIVGRVGTGLSDKLREDLHKHPTKYIGLVAKVDAQEKYVSGALRMPAFKGWHLDKNDRRRLDQVVLG